jgi:hypothetical protein
MRRGGDALRRWVTNLLDCLEMLAKLLVLGCR